MHRVSRTTIFILESVVCFGPLTLSLLLGTLILPTWIRMLSGYLRGTHRPYDPNGDMPWDVIWPILLVLAGYVGLVGLIRVLSIIIRGVEIPTGRITTLATVAFGVSGLVSFNVQGGFADPRDNLAGALVSWILPAVGTLHLLFVARGPLFRRSDA